MTVKVKILKDLEKGNRLAMLIYWNFCSDGRCEDCPVRKYCNNTFEEIKKKTGKSPSCIEVVKKILKKEVNLCQVNGK